MQKRIPLYKWMAELNFAIFNFLKSGNRIMTEDTDCVNMCLKIILPKNRKNSKSGNRGWHHAAYSKKKVFR